MTTPDPIAIVGIAGLFPGAPDLETFWHNILERRDAVSEPPEGRWPVPAADLLDPTIGRPDRLYATRACFLEPFELDLSDVPLDPALVARLDPLYHLVLRIGIDAWRDACRHSGVPPAAAKSGIILANIALPTDGASALTRETLGRAFDAGNFGERNGDAAENGWDFARRDSGRDTWRQGDDGGEAGTGTHPLNRYVTAYPAALLCQALGLEGGSYTLDAACASTLYSLHLACGELRAGRLDAVLAGGVSRPQSLYTQIGFSQLQALSRTGVCRPFDTRADGLVVGEGGGMFVLRRLEDAVTAGDRIYAVIKGTGLSNDVGGSLLAPASEGQRRAMRQAYDAAGWSPADVDLIECHGTGTPRGDAVELSSLKALWSDSGTITSGRPCVIGSVKSNVGHLLTAAGAAGLAKVILALRNATLPPSANFERHTAAVASAEPFQVLEAPQPWPRRAPGCPRRAAVSAFGFGGINAHLLLEEWSPESSPSSRSFSFARPVVRAASPEVAIVGMATHIGPLKTLTAFQEAVLRGTPVQEVRPAGRWHGIDQSASFQAFTSELCAVRGAWIETLEIPVGRFRVPPGEVPGLLPQQLVMLEVAVAAMEDAGANLSRTGPDVPRLRTGCVVGMSLDLETTRFHLGWLLRARVRGWCREHGVTLDRAEEDAWLEALADALGPPLDANRTLGALGGMIASRIAREVQLGGPSFAVSGEEVSGLRALEVAVRMLQRGEVDSMIAGAVDMAGDVRAMLAGDALRPWTRGGPARPFDARASGPTVGEGAAAVVLKRLEDARRDGDRIYAVVKGIGAAHGAASVSGGPTLEVCSRALAEAYRDACVDPISVSLIEAHGSGSPVDDRVEAGALLRFLPGRDDPWCTVSSAKCVVGHTGAACGMVSLVKAALCLYQEVLPPMPGFRSPVDDAAWSGGVLHIPIAPQYWLRDRAAGPDVPGGGPRRAGVSAMSVDGHYLHAVLEEAPETSSVPSRCRAERVRPAGDRGVALFILEASGEAELHGELAALRRLALTDMPAGRDARRHHPDATGSPGEAGIELLAATWHRRRAAIAHKHGPSIQAYVKAFAVRSRHELLKQLEQPVSSSPPLKGGVAFVFPGSGNHYPGMGRALGVAFPDVLRALDRESGMLRSQLMPRWYAPWRHCWDEDWESDAALHIAASPERMIFGQVAHSITMAEHLRRFGLRPDAVIGYSLGESAGLFATRAWTDRDEMYRRILESPLFSTQLAGPCTLARDAWGVPEADWRVAVVNRSADIVRRSLAGTVSLLIVNAPEECVVGGRQADVEALIQRLGCEALLLEGVPTVHCSLVLPVADSYRALHHLPTRTIPGVRFYSGAWARSYPLSEEGAASSILANAVEGFDFRATIEQAWADGIRFFVEVGPQSSCTRMIHRTLEGREHLAVAACQRGRDAVWTLLRALGRLAEAGVPIDLEPLYGEDSGIMSRVSTTPAQTIISVSVGGRAPGIVRPPEVRSSARDSGNVGGADACDRSRYRAAEDIPEHPVSDAAAIGDAILPAIEAWRATHQLARGFAAASQATATAHERFLEQSDAAVERQRQVLAFQMRLAGALFDGGTDEPDSWPISSDPPMREVLECAPDVGLADGSTRQAPVLDRAQCLELAEGSTRSVPALEREVGVRLADGCTQPAPMLDRAQCLEFAVGSIARVLGPEFALADGFPTRVRLPDEPLMLVDRILTIEGTRGTPGPGRVVTEHDVVPGAWYLDGGRAPVCISVEAGQADLFLSAWLGIDLRTRGERVYRLLDAQVEFHRDLPTAGDTIRYDIRIDRFVRQGETWMFFFRFTGWIGDEHLITMRDGCAGFFSQAQLEGGRGIVAELPGAPPPRRVDAHGRPTEPFTPLVAMERESFHDDALDALRTGDLERAFGPRFAGLTLLEPLRLPGGRMRLVHRILELDPTGGSYGLGTIRGAADVHPGDWYLTCHFADDPVMPGTLMYECCMHTLRVYLLRMGWIGAADGPAVSNDGGPGLHCAPIPLIASRLRCRGQVTPSTREIVYRIDLKEIGYDPEPYVLADALMYADGRRIVQMESMSLRIVGLTREGIEAHWRSHTAAPQPATYRTPLYDRDRILAFAIGRPSDAFGDRYRVFDATRRIARLPGPPFCFLDRVLEAGPEPWVLKPGGWAETEYDIPPDAWYFTANRQPTMPFAVVLEAALQPCGWLAGYLGSALRSEEDLHFRNLEGTATLMGEITPETGTLTVRVRLTEVSEAGGMILQRFEMALWGGDRLLYAGDTRFGFFPARSLAQQVGVRGAAERAWVPDRPGRAFTLPRTGPHTPDACLKRPDPLVERPVASRRHGLTLPAGALLMIDHVDCYLPDGGPRGLGYISATRAVDPEEWFFAAHFHQDPVIPGSLGLEAFLQLLKVVAIDLWGAELRSSHRFEPIALGRTHRWWYRGQVIPANREVKVEAVITGLEQGERPVLTADGFLRVDGRIIYEMKDFALRLVPDEDAGNT